MRYIMMGILVIGWLILLIHYQTITRFWGHWGMVIIYTYFIVLVGYINFFTFTMLTSNQASSESLSVEDPLL